MTTNELATAIANSTETEKATLAQYLTDAMAMATVPGEQGDHDATKRLIVGAMDRFAAEHGAA